MAGRVMEDSVCAPSTRTALPVLIFSRSARDGEMNSGFSAGMSTIGVALPELDVLVANRIRTGASDRQDPPDVKNTHPALYSSTTYDKKNRILRGQQNTPERAPPPAFKKSTPKLFVPTPP